MQTIFSRTRAKTFEILLSAEDKCQNLQLKCCDWSWWSAIKGPIGPSFDLADCNDSKINVHTIEFVCIFLFFFLIFFEFHFSFSV